tara:strand:- start:4864 stop:5277 length:414 start_codon:yes stop_codon:yes gene_type:complete
MIQQHHTDEDIQLLFFKEDFSRWNDEVELINLEISFYNGMFISDFISKLQSDFYSTQTLNANLLDFELKHRKIIKELKHFSYKTEGLKECDDLQCENYFMNGTASFKTKIEKHFADFRTLKKEILLYLNSGLQKYVR